MDYQALVLGARQLARTLQTNDSPTELLSKCAQYPLHGRTLPLRTVYKHDTPLLINLSLPTSTRHQFDINSTCNNNCQLEPTRHS